MFKLHVLKLCVLLFVSKNNVHSTAIHTMPPDFPNKCVVSNTYILIARNEDVLGSISTFPAYCGFNLRWGAKQHYCNRARVATVGSAAMYVSYHGTTFARRSSPRFRSPLAFARVTVVPPPFNMPAIHFVCSFVGFSTSDS